LRWRNIQLRYVVDVDLIDAGERTGCAHADNTYRFSRTGSGDRWRSASADCTSRDEHRSGIHVRGCARRK
jgi:hypothetical protein